MGKNRLEAFSDGVLAIVITIMVLELSLPSGPSLKDLAELAPILQGYALSFLFISIYWINHHLLFQNVDTINMKVLWCNIAWLFVVSLIPFATAWIGRYPTASAPVAFYFGVIFLSSLTFHLIYYFVQKSGNKTEFRLRTRNIASLITYFLAPLLGVFYPVAAYIVVIAITLWWTIPHKK